MMPSLKALLFSAILPYAALANPVITPELEARACTVPSNSVKNGGFESGLTNWNVTKTYSGSPGGPVSCTVVNSGFNSSHSAQMTGSSVPGDAGNELYLTQQFTACKNTTYTIGWSIFQVAGSTTRAGGYPYMQVSMYTPDNHCCPSLIADFEFGPTSYNASNYNAYGKEKISTVGKAGVWNSYSATFPYVKPGPWVVQFELVVESYKTTKGATTIQIDGVVAKPLS